MNTFTTLAVVGLAVHASINLVAMFVFKKAAAEFFSEPWWSAWFPSYIVWFVFLVVGLANRGKKD